VATLSRFKSPAEEQAGVRAFGIVGLLDRFMPEYRPPPVPLEGVRGVWTAANTKGGLSLAGGQAIVTKDHLAFTLFKLLNTAGAPGWVGKINELIDESKLLGPAAIPLSEIAGTHTLNRAEVLKPPTVRMSLRDGRHFDLGILVSPKTPNFSSSNNDAFDHFLREREAARSQAAAAS
jgi:hypothetical protein